MSERQRRLRGQARGKCFSANLLACASEDAFSSPMGTRIRFLGWYRPGIGHPLFFLPRTSMTATVISPAQDRDRRASKRLRVDASFHRFRSHFLEGHGGVFAVVGHADMAVIGERRSNDRNPGGGNRGFVSGRSGWGRTCSIVLPGKRHRHRCSSGSAPSVLCHRHHADGVPKVPLAQHRMKIPTGCRGPGISPRCRHHLSRRGCRTGLGHVVPLRRWLR
jgi:hypothetical protein